MRVNFEYDMHLQYENRALKARIRELESGAAYVRMQEECEKRCREMEREVRKLKTELENAVRQLRQNREHWFQVYGDMEKEHKKVVERKQGEIRRLQKLCEKTAIAYEQMHEKYLGQLHLRYAAESALEEEKRKNQKLRAQLNPEPSLGIRVTAGKNRNQQFPRPFCRHRKQSLKTRILKRLPKRS